MSTSSIVVIAAAVVLGLWMLGARNRLVRHRNEVLQTFAKLYEQLARRHVLTQDLIARATQVAAGDPRVRLQSVAATHEAARTAADYAKASPLDAARINVVDRAEVALSHRLARFMGSLVLSSACRGDDELRRLRHDITDGMAPLDFAAQAFNHAVLAYNRAAREAPTHLVARTFGFRDAAVVSPSVGKLPLRRKKARLQDAGREATDTAAAPTANPIAADEAAVVEPVAVIDTATKTAPAPDGAVAATDAPSSGAGPISPTNRPMAADDPLAAGS